MLNSSVQDCKTAVTFAPTLIEKHLQSASGVNKTLKLRILPRLMFSFFSLSSPVIVSQGDFTHETVLIVIPWQYGSME